MINQFVYFFFFQAEDGIRDIGVTGVQTCALPILGSWLNLRLADDLETRNVKREELQMSTFTYNPAEFSLDDTLASGQCFRWKRNSYGWWTGVVGSTIIGIRQDGEQFSWWTYPEAGDETLLADYFQLHVDLGEI